MLNKELIYSRFDDINDSIERLEKIKAISEKDFLIDSDLKDIASYKLITIIEASLTICQHICAKELKKAPVSYSHCFKLLAENNLLEDKLAIKLQKMARFRNMLIHTYWNIDYSLVYEIIQKNLIDVKKFIIQISDIIE